MSLRNLAEPVTLVRSPIVMNVLAELLILFPICRAGENLRMAPPEGADQVTTPAASAFSWPGAARPRPGDAALQPQRSRFRSCRSCPARKSLQVPVIVLARAAGAFPDRIGSYSHRRGAFHRFP